MTAILQIAGATVRRSMRNRSFLVLGLLAPFFIMAALSATIGSALAGEFRPSLVLANEIGGDALDGVRTGLLDNGFNDVSIVSNSADARSRIEDRQADAAIIFPANLVNPAAAAPAITVVVDAESEIAGDVATAIASQNSRTFSTIRVLNTLRAPIDDLSGPISISAANDVGSSVLTDSTYFAVGMSSFFAVFAAAGLLANYHRERRESTLARMLISPIGRFAPIIGKGLGVAALTLVSFTVLVVTSSLLLDADWGRLVGVVAVGLALAFTAVAVSTAVVAWTRSEMAASQVGMVLATAWAIFGGVFVEIPRSGPLAAVSRLSPFTWALDAIGLNAGTGTITDVLLRALAIAGFGAVALAIALVQRRELGRA